MSYRRKRPPALSRRPHRQPAAPAQAAPRFPRARRKEDGRDAHFRAAQDDAIRDVVKLQEECGLQVVTDGEFRRISYWEKFVRLTKGLVVKDAVFKFHDEHGHEQRLHRALRDGEGGAAPSRSRWTSIAFVAPLTKATPKITMPAPSTMHFYRFTRVAATRASTRARASSSPTSARSTRRRSPTSRARAAATCSSTRWRWRCSAIPAAQAQGARRRRQPGRARRPLRRRDQRGGEGPARRTWSSACTCAAATTRACTSPRAATTRSPSACSSARTSNHFLLEFDTPRAGDFAPLRLVPKTKGVVLGLVSSKSPQLEPMDVLKRRADGGGEARRSRACAISPQCGFASTMGGNPVTEADERAKLRLCVEAARAIWG